MVNRPICRSVDISRREAGEPRKGLTFDFWPCLRLTV